MHFIDLSQVFLGCRIMEDMMEKKDNIYCFHFPFQFSKALVYTRISWRAR